MATVDGAQLQEPIRGRGRAQGDLYRAACELGQQAGDVTAVPHRRGWPAEAALDAQLRRRAEPPRRRGVEPCLVRANVLNAG
jgi:hypothetical protein